MRVVLNMSYLASENFGGSWTYSYNLARYLPHAGRDHEFIVIVNSQIASQFRNLDVEIIPVDVGAGTRMKRVFWEQLSLPRLIRTLKPDVFHSTGNILPLRAHRPSVVTVHDVQYKYYPKNFSVVKRNFLRAAIPYSVHAADRIICVSRFTQNDVITMYGVDPVKTTVVYEAGLSEDELQSATGETELREKYRLRRPFILYAGSTFPHKNLNRLVEAFTSVKDQIGHDLVIVGQSFGGDESLSHWSSAERGNTEPRIIRTGFVGRQDLVGLYSAARCYLFPSLFEGFGIPVIEAMQCGCPVVTSQCTSLLEVGGDAVLYVDPYDASSIAHGIVAMVTDEQLRKKYIAKGYSHAGGFSWSAMAAETIQVYEQLASRRAAARPPFS